MMRKLVAGVLSLNLIMLVPSAHAAAAKQDKAGQSTTQGPRRHLANIVFAGLAGAVLGLSTLSFYGRPQDRLSNIAVGFAIGVITGTVYTTYKAAVEPKDFYSVREPKAELWASENATLRTNSIPRSSLVFEF